MKVSQATLVGMLARGISNIQMPKTLGQVMAEKVVPFNKEPRPGGQATLRQREVTRGPCKGKGTRRKR
jgi:hypothetical protein